MTKVKTPLFETPPIEGELWYDVQYLTDIEYMGRPEDRVWSYILGVPVFKSRAIACAWVDFFQARARAAGYELPPIRLKEHFEPWEEVAGVWRGHPCPKEVIPRP